MPTLTRTPPSDAELVDAVRAGSLEALGQVYARHGAAVFAAAYRVTAARADAEDVLQDVFVGLPHALERYHDRGQLQAWLRRVAVRVALMRLRARTRRREEAFDDVGDLPADGADGVVHRVALEAALRRLPEPLRLVFVLKEMEGYSHDAVAAELGISANASAVRLFRAWKLLRNGASR